MPRTALTVKTPPGPHPGAIAANGADFTWEVGDNVNGNDFTPTGEELLLVRNDDAGAQTVTITTAPDKFARNIHHHKGGKRSCAIMQMALPPWTCSSCRRSGSDYSMDWSFLSMAVGGPSIWRQRTIRQLNG